MTVRTAVITAAGFGTRFLPATKVIPKELLPIVDRPMVQYAVEEAVDAGIERIILVTSPRTGTLVRDHFRPSPHLESILEARTSEHLNGIRELSRMAEIISVEQKEPVGLGHAVLTAQPLVGFDPFVVYLPDDLIWASPSATRQMLPAFEIYGNIIAVESILPELVINYGVVGGTMSEPGILKLNQVIEKPPIKDAPSNLAIVGRYVFSSEIFECLNEISVGTNQELQLTDAIAALINRGSVYSYEFEGKRYDCGTPDGLLMASIEIALSRSEFSSKLRAWLEGLRNI